MKIDIGKKIKDISVITTDNKKKLSDYLNKNLILYFYLSKIKRAGWSIVGVSRDPIKSHLKFIDKHLFKFPLISDEDEKVCNMFDVIKEKSLYGRKYMGIDRSTFLIGTDFKVIGLWRNVKVKGHVNEVINKIKELK
jgi:peroxiredoxin Q/BCP